MPPASKRTDAVPTMRLYGYYRSSASYRIRIALNLKNLPWENLSVLLNRGEQNEPSFTALNPSGLVPVLDTGDGALSQSFAIAEFLEERHPAPPLLPRDAIGRARVREMMAVIGCDVHPLQNLRVLNYLRDEFGADEDAVTRWCQRWIANGLSAFESLTTRYGGDGLFAYGDSPTFADAWLVPQLYNARRFKVDLAPYARIGAIDAHCLTLAAFADAQPERQADAPAPPRPA